MSYEKGRVLPVLGVVVLVVFIGIKMTSRGWVSLDKAKSKAEQKAQAEQPVPMVWPPALAPQSDSFCHTIKLNLAQVDKAMEEGIPIDQQRRCITRAAMTEYEDAKVSNAALRTQRTAQEAEQKQIELVVEQQISSGTITLQNLMQARAGKATMISTALLPSAHKPIKAMPTPPAQWFVPMSYQSGNLSLKAFVTPKPADGKRLPLMVWLTGGDSNTLDDFWTEGAESNDQSAAAFRKAGMAMLFPTLRGGNDNPGQREYFWGEVQDVAAAILQAAQLPYIDASRIYLGGHSTGATLALLTAAAGLPVQGVFAFGPVDEISGYDWPLKWSLVSADERRMRSPMYWMHAIKSPTWIIEGNKRPSNIRSLDNLCAARKSEQVHCVSVQGGDHFSVLQPITRKIASQLVMGQPVQLQRDEKL